MIYDCFTFFNELELLEIRLHELDEVVDTFVLCEATYTHQGKKKPLYFEKNKHLFSKFAHKIVHVISDQMPTGWEANNWLLENQQRNDLMMGLKQAKDNDTIILSDLDEIPDSDKIKQLRGTTQINFLALKNHYYFLNLHDVKQKGSLSTLKYQILGYFSKYYYNKWMISRFWSGPVVFPFTCTKSYTLQDLRNLREDARKIENIISEGGWHFSYLGGAERIVQKVEAFAHTEVNTQVHKDMNVIMKAIASGRSVHDANAHLIKVPVVGHYPRYIQQNVAKFQHLILQ